VVLREGDEVGVDKDNVLEVVDDRLAVKEVVGHDEEVPGVSTRPTGTGSPVESLVPSVTSNLLVGAAVAEVKEGGNLLVDESLAEEDEHDHVRVAHAEKDWQSAPQLLSTRR
jgi:hypothetical protein